MRKAWGKAMSGARRFTASLVGIAFACAVLAGSAGAVLAATANLSLAIADDKDPVISGATVSYLATVFNGGPEAASNVVMTISLSPEVAYQSDDGGCTNAGNPQEWTCTIGPLASGEARGITFTTLVTGPVGQTTASVSGTVAPVGDIDPDESDNFASQATIVGDGPADLRLTMFGPPPDVIPALTEVAYTLLVENLGAGVADQGTLVFDVFGNAAFTVTAIYPDLLGNRSGASCTPSAPIGPDLATQITCTLAAPMERLGALSKSGRWLLEFRVVPTGPMVLFAAGGISSATPDPDPANDTAALTSRISEVADLSVSLSSDLPAISPGQVTVYSAVVQNAGPSQAEDTRLYLELPGFVILEIETIGTASCTPGARIECGLGDILPGGFRTLRIKGYVKRSIDDPFHQGGGTVTSAVYDHDISNNYATITTPVRVGSLLVNPSFESDPRIPATDWLFFDNDSSELWDCTTGSGSACSVSFEAGTGGFKTVTQTQLVHGLRGDAVEFNGWSRTKGVPAAGLASLRVTLFNNNGTTTVKTVNFSAGSHAWQRRASTLVALRNFYAAAIQFRFKAPAGKVWFDRASLIVRPQ